MLDPAQHISSSDLRKAGFTRHQVTPPDGREFKPSTLFGMRLISLLAGKTDIERHDLCFEILSAQSSFVESIDYGTGKNIVCTFSSNPTHRIVLGAHYDRVSSSPGVNDNAAAVAQLTTFCSDLYQSGVQREDLTVVLYDNEELLMSNAQVTGSYQFASYLKDCGVTPEKYIAFDVTGNGNVAVISSTAGTSEALKAQIRKDLDSYGIPSLEKATPPSDSLMIRMVGFDCALICTLPATTLENLSPKGFPEEWQRLHSPRDDLTSVTFESTEFMLKALHALVSS